MPSPRLNEYTTTQRKSQEIKDKKAKIRIGAVLEKVALIECGSYRKYEECPVDVEHHSQLVWANLCKSRWCPECARIAARERAERMSIVLAHLQQQQGTALLFLTLTVRNCVGNDLHDSIKAMQAALTKKLLRLQNNNGKKAYKNVYLKDDLLGWYYTLEVTYNSDTHTYHPHLHCLLHVKQAYFSRHYKSAAEWSKMWAECMSLDYLPVVDVRKIKDLTASEELSKYVSKVYELPDDALLELSVALDKVRTKSAAGTIKAALSQTKKALEEAKKTREEGMEKECPKCGAILEETDFFWNGKIQDFVC